MVAVRLTPSFPLTVVGSPEYLRRKGRPEHVDDLRRHACIRIDYLKSYTGAGAIV